MEDSAGRKTWYNEDKVDETVLSLLWLAGSGQGTDQLDRVIASTDPQVLRRLEARGLIIGSGEGGDETLSDEGRRSSELLFNKLFGSPTPGTMPRQPAGRQVEEEDGE